MCEHDCERIGELEGDLASAAIVIMELRDELTALRNRVLVVERATDLRASERAWAVELGLADR